MKRTLLMITTALALAAMLPTMADAQRGGGGGAGGASAGGGGAGGAATTGTTAAGRSATYAELTVACGFAIDRFPCRILARQDPWRAHGVRAASREYSMIGNNSRASKSANTGCYLCDFSFFLRCASVRKRSAFSLMNPSASRWS